MEEDAEGEVVEEDKVPALGQERVHLREHEVEERCADQRGRDRAETLLDALQELVAPGRVLDAAEGGAVGDEGDLVDLRSGEEREGGMGQLVDDRADVRGIGPDAEGDERACDKRNDRRDGLSEELHDKSQCQDGDGEQHRRDEDQ